MTDDPAIDASMSDDTDERSYWYAQSDHERGVRVLQAMRLYRSAEAAMRRRTRDAMQMGENDLLALRYVIGARQRGTAVTPTDLSRYLGVKTSSVTAMIDRLETAGHLRRVPSASDRRRLTVEPTAHADAMVRATLGEMHERMLGATVGLDADAALSIVEFLDRMRDAVDAIDRNDKIVTTDTIPTTAAVTEPAEPVA